MTICEGKDTISPWQNALSISFYQPRWSDRRWAANTTHCSNSLAVRIICWYICAGGIHRLEACTAWFLQVWCLLLIFLLQCINFPDKQTKFQTKVFFYRHKLGKDSWWMCAHLLKSRYIDTHLSWVCSLCHFFVSFTMRNPCRQTFYVS